jgi:F-type H+/Na+-transporting ATPase subunit alpha
MSVAQDLLKKIEEQINSADLSEEFSKKGTILEIKDGVATVTGLECVSFSEIVEFENGLKWLVLDLLKEHVGVLILGDYGTLAQGDTVKGTGHVFSVWVWEEYLGRVVDGLGEAIDGLGEIKAKIQYPVERIAPWVIARQWVDTPMMTGLKSVDAMIPIGRGQRELIIWDRQTGKSTVAIDTILNQKGQDIKCIYVSIGQKESKVRNIVEVLKAAWAMEYTTVVSASASKPAVEQYLSAYVGCSIAEYYLYNGQDALIIYDDLSKHAVAYREVSLLLRRPPGREAYPGDVFYLHSRLLERSAKVSAEYLEDISWGKVKGSTGSLTALPIIETQAGDVSAYIPTNVISITDGQIFLDTDLFNSWVKPAIDVWLSVSRVWGAAQTHIMKKVSGKLKLMLATFREMEAFSQFASDLDESTRKVLERWVRLVEMLKQWVNAPIPFQKQVVTIYAWVNNFFDELEVDQIWAFEAALYEKLDTTYKSLQDEIVATPKLTDEVEEQMRKVIQEAVSEVK